MPVRKGGTPHRFPKIYYTLMAKRLKESISRREIAEEIHRRSGKKIPTSTVSHKLYKFFPIDRVNAGESIDSLLWETRERISRLGVSWDRSKQQSRLMRSRTAEQKTASAKKGSEARTHEQRSDQVKAVWAARTPAERAAIIRRSNLARSAEQRSASSRKAALKGLRTKKAKELPFVEYDWGLLSIASEYGVTLSNQREKLNELKADHTKLKEELRSRRAKGEDEAKLIKRMNKINFLILAIEESLVSESRVRR